MPMYEVDGAFGKVRIVDLYAPPDTLDTFCGIEAAGWHSCNSLYHITREHGCSSYLLFFTLAGEGALRIGERTYALTPGTVTIVPPQVPHAYGTPPDRQWDFYWLHLAAGEAARLADRAVGYGAPVFRSRDIRPYADRMEDLLLTLATPSAGLETATLARVSMIMSALLHQLLLERAGTDAPPEDCVSRRAIRYMETHLADDLRLEALSAALYVSPAVLIRCFKAETGYTPHAYLGRLRVVKARRLLKYTDRSVAEVAASVGFQDVSAFIRLYRKWEGVTPGADRKAR